MESEFPVVLDACVLVPMALCDFLLRLAEERAMYRPLWSAQTLEEMSRALETKLRRTPRETAWRRKQMNEAFPEALIAVPPELLRAVECIPDKNDRHVLATAVVAHAKTIVTQNLKHFPKKCLEGYGVHCQTADDFLIDQYRLDPQLVLDKLDDQGAGIEKSRAFVVGSLKNSAPRFCEVVEGL